MFIFGAPWFNTCCWHRWWSSHRQLWNFGVKNCLDFAAWALYLVCFFNLHYFSFSLASNLPNSGWNWQQESFNSCQKDTLLFFLDWQTAASHRLSQLTLHWRDCSKCADLRRSGIGPDFSLYNMSVMLTILASVESHWHTVEDLTKSWASAAKFGSKFHCVLTSTDLVQAHLPFG